MASQAEGFDRALDLGGTCGQGVTKDVSDELSYGLLQIVGGGGGYRKRAGDDKNPSSYHRRQGSDGRTTSGTLNLSRSNSAARSQPSRQSSAALPRTASGIASLQRLDQELESGESPVQSVHARFDTLLMKVLILVS